MSDIFSTDIIWLGPAPLIDALRTANRVVCNTKEERRELSRRTVWAMGILTYGAWECADCGVGADGCWGFLEGHHVYPSTRRLSEYKHLVSQKFRLRALRRLQRSMAYHLILLCKSCHTARHVQMRRSVENGIGGM